tara:strand:+ start:826 stop:1023 length:198 start_codon:yes stop_codon:yes gene_type:complete
MLDQGQKLQTVTKVDLALRKEMRNLSKASSEADRVNTLNQIDELKNQRHQMTRSRGFDRMLTALR